MSDKSIIFTPSRITLIRKTLGWNQSKLAEISGITQATISRIESGKVKDPHIAQLLKIAKAFNTTVDNIVSCKETDNA